MKKVIISTVVVLSIAVAGYFIVDSQVVTEAEKIEAAQKRKERTIKSRKYVLELHKSDLIKYKSQYEEDPSNMNALSLVTEKYWLIAKAYKDLDKRLGRQPSTELIERNMQKSLQYFEEFDSKMSEGWGDPEFRDKNQWHVKSLIKFYHHLKIDYIAANEWRERFIEVWQDKWDAGQQTYEVAYWLYHLNSSWSATYLYDIDKSITGRKTGIAPNTLEIDKWKKIVQKMSQEGKKPIGWSMPRYY